MTTNNDARVAIYTTPTCPDCHALKAWLSAQGVPFVEKDLTDIDVMTEVREKTGGRGAPITIIGDKVFVGTFAAQKSGIAEALGLSNATQLLEAGTGTGAGQEK